jgi:hypothetical protein
MASYLALVINSGNGGVQRANSGAFAGALFSAPEGLEN